MSNIQSIPTSEAKSNLLPPANRAALFADEVSFFEPLTIFIPDRDALGRSIPAAYWVAATAQLLAHKFGGSTVSAVERGIYVNPQTDNLIEEWTHRVTVFVDAEALHEHASSIERHVRRFGYETNQHEVLVRLGTKLLRFRDFHSQATH